MRLNWPSILFIFYSRQHYWDLPPRFAWEEILAIFYLSYKYTYLTDNAERADEHINTRQRKYIWYLKVRNNDKPIEYETINITLYNLITRGRPIKDIKVFYNIVM